MSQDEISELVKRLRQPAYDPDSMLLDIKSTELVMCRAADVIERAPHLHKPTNHAFACTYGTCQTLIWHVIGTRAVIHR